MNDLQKMAEALRHWQDVSSMYKVEIDKLNERIDALMERIADLKTEIEKEREDRGAE